MTGRLPTGWQTILADLALILFIATAAAGLEARAPATAAQAPPRTPVSLALWRADGGEKLAEWLARQPPDPRATLEIAVRYTPQGRAHGWEQAEALEVEAQTLAPRIRTLLRPGPADTVEARIAYD